jgi:type I restriction-modification system DNA methylase subunit
MGTKRGKYRDVILPMTVLRRLHSVLEPTKQAVLDMKTASTAKELPTRMMHYVPSPDKRFTTPPRFC